MPASHGTLGNMSKGTFSVHSEAQTGGTHVVQLQLETDQYTAAVHRWTRLFPLVVLLTAACRQLPVQPGTGTGAAGKGAANTTAADSEGKTATKVMADTAADGEGDRKPSSNTGSGSSGAKESSADKDASGSNGNAANSGGTSRSAPGSATSTAADGGMPAKPRDATTIDACVDKQDEYLCDNRKLYHCLDGNNAAPELCTNPAQCEAGLMTGACGECDPGTFRCTGADLEECDDTGHFMAKETCASEKLCKDTTGICDTKVCSAGEYRCDDSGALEVCRDDLSDFQREMTCPPGLCNWEAQRCNDCMPNVVACRDPSTLSNCSADGLEEVMPCSADTPFCVDDACVACRSDQDCTAGNDNECGTRKCQAGACVAGDPKPARTPCSGGICDYLGACVECISDADCNDPMLRCLTGVACVNRNTIEASPSLLGGWSVTISAGYSADISASFTYTVSSLLNSNTNLKTIGGNPTESRTYTISAAGYSACGLLKVGRDLEPVTLTFAENTDGGTGLCSGATSRVMTLTPKSL